MIWVCILCRKKQELLIKTGQWLHSGMAAKQRAMEAGEEDEALEKEDIDQRPKLERAHSEGKENVTQGSLGRGMSRRGSLQQIHRANSQRELRRQFSQEKEPPKPEDTSDHQRYPERSRPPSERSPPEVKRVRGADISARDNFSRVRGNERDSRRYYDGCSDPSYDRQKDRYGEPSNHRHSQDTIRERDSTWRNEHHKSRDDYQSGDRRHTIRDQHWASQEDERTHSDSAAFSRRISQESLRDHSDRPHRDSRVSYADDDWRDSRKRDYEVHSDDPRLRLYPMRTGDDRRNHLEPGYASDGRGRGHNNRKKVESVVRNDSLSSDQSESVRPPPPKPHKNKRGRKLRQKSLSSSDDEIRSTPECSSCEERDAESESISEKGKYFSMFINKADKIQ